MEDDTISRANSGEADSWITTQQSSRLLYTSQTHCHVHNNPPLYRILNKMNAIHTHHNPLGTILILSCNLYLYFFQSCFSFNFLYGFLISPMRAT